MSSRILLDPHHITKSALGRGPGSSGLITISQATCSRWTPISSDFLQDYAKSSQVWAMIWAATRWRGHSSGPTGSHKSPYCCCCFVDGLQLWIIFVASSCQNWWQLQCALRWNIFHPENFNIWTLLPSSGFFLLWGHLTPESRCRSESSKTLLGKAEEDRYNAARSFSPWTGLFWPPASLPGSIFSSIFFWLMPRDAHWGEMAHCRTRPWLDWF